MMPRANKLRFENQNNEADLYFFLALPFNGSKETRSSISVSMDWIFRNARAKVRGASEKSCIYLCSVDISMTC